MLKVLFFAGIKEQLDCGALELEWSGAATDLDALQQQLCAQHEGKWREVLGQDNVIRAVNQTVVEGNSTLRDGDEVAFYPPVTGG